MTRHRIDRVSTAVWLLVAVVALTWAGFLAWAVYQLAHTIAEQVAAGITTTTPGRNAS